MTHNPQTSPSRLITELADMAKRAQPLLTDEQATHRAYTAIVVLMRDLTDSEAAAREVAA